MNQIKRQFDKLEKYRIRERILAKKVDQEEKKVGDACKMEDGSEGVLEDKDGKLVCVPPKKE